MSEAEDAIMLANRVLERVNADPDDNLAVLARTLLRSVETRCNICGFLVNTQFKAERPFVHVGVGRPPINKT